jgi:hypothetical protein
MIIIELFLTTFEVKAFFEAIGAAVKNWLES